ncbi:hypothetical protein ACFVWG_35790 [Kribbella sp. NPDC058245]|uniref:hypothetical protein n=1 Tax=Kribbella sp. NPDC058245 TaxID=3346399 RepID=UPI0036E29316
MQVEEALALWDEFPVRREPRPIVLMDAAIGPGQLPRIEDRERVLGVRPVVSDVELPPGLLDRLQPMHPDDSDPVRVTKVRLVSPEFRTDRGHRPLPAYRLELAERVPRTRAGGGAVTLLMLDAWTESRMWWPEGLSTRWRGGSPGMSASMLMDGGRTIRLLFGGSLPSYAAVRVRAVHESSTAVLVEIEEVPYRPGSPVPLALAGRMVVVRLPRPLGGRVLVHAGGLPVEVTAAG